ncbi:MAG: histidine phosphotransferase family protein [Pseudomonadota bacterium]
MITQLKIAELLCTRLCHDLTGPIGAMANGAEFLADEGFDMQAQAIDLIGSSAAQAVARLQFYRKAYGRINDSGEANIEELKKTAGDFFAGTRVIIDWADNYTDASGVSISYKMGRLLLNMLIISSASLIGGGTITIRLLNDGQFKKIELTSSGAKIKWEAETETILNGHVAIESLTPKNVQIELTRMLANEIEAGLAWSVKENSVELCASKPISI